MIMSIFHFLYLIMPTSEIVNSEIVISIEQLSRIAILKEQNLKIVILIIVFLRKTQISINILYENSPKRRILNRLLLGI